MLQRIARDHLHLRDGLDAIAVLLPRPTLPNLGAALPRTRGGICDRAAGGGRLHEVHVHGASLLDALELAQEPAHAFGVADLVVGVLLSLLLRIHRALMR